jgi:hypothetical protein
MTYTPACCLFTSHAPARAHPAPRSPAINRERDRTCRAPPAAPRPPLARPSGYALSGGSAGCALSLPVRWSAWCAAGAPAAACRAQPKTADHAKSEQEHSGRITNIARPRAECPAGVRYPTPSTIATCEYAPPPCTRPHTLMYGLPAVWFCRVGIVASVPASLSLCQAQPDSSHTCCQAVTPLSSLCRAPQPLSATLACHPLPRQARISPCGASQLGAKLAPRKPPPCVSSGTPSSGAWAMLLAAAAPCMRLPLLRTALRMSRIATW